MRNDLASFVQDFERHRRQTAIVSYAGIRRRSISYAELAVLAGRFSRLLSERGIAPGARVLLWGANSAEWVGAFFGCVLRGVIAVPLDAAGSAEFATRVIGEVSPALLAGDEDLLARLPGAYSKIALEGLTSQLPHEPLMKPEPSLGPATPLQIIFTSGTTSAPKGIVHTHGNVLASVEVLEREIAKYLRYERWVHPLRILHTLPLSHVFGQFMGLWVPPLLGSPVYFDDKLSAEHLVARIRGERISVAAVVPRVLELMRLQLLSQDPRLETRIHRALKYPAWRRWWRMRDVHRRFGWKFWAFVSGGATLPAEVEQFWNALGFLLVQGYGMTETTALATLNHPLHPSAGTIGKPLAGREVRLGEDGEILVRGPMIAAGTWRNGKLQPGTGEWLHTGDLGSFDSEGRLRFAGRKGDVIVAASGMNIHPADVEEALREQAGVQEAVVVAWDGPRGGEPVGVVILDPAHETADEQTLRGTLDRVLIGANKRLEEYQRMRQVFRWPEPEFPRNSLGKLLRREVAGWVRQQMQPGSADQAPASGTDGLRNLIARLTGANPDQLDDDADLATAARLDSLARMQLAIGIEEEFGVPVTDEAIASAKTVGDLRALIGARRPAADEVQRQPAGTPGTAAVRAVRDQPAMRAAESYAHWPWSRPVQAVRVVFVEGILRPLVAVLGRPRIERSAAGLPEQPCLYVANHVTAVDVPLVLAALPRRVRDRMAVAMSAELLASWKQARRSAGIGPGPLRLLGPLQALAVTALLNTFPLPAGAGLRASFAHAGEALDRGFNVLIFPEGRRSQHDALQEFQTGIGILAQQSGAAVVPVALAGLYGGRRKRARFAGRAGLRVAVRVGQALWFQPGESPRDFTGRLHNAVKHLISVGGEG